MIEPRPCSPAEAVQRALAMLALPSNAATGYVYGGGDYHPVMLGGRLIDVPWTQVVDSSGLVHVGADCRVAFLWCYKVQAKRPGYNTGSWATVSDDVNYNSLIEDGDHAQDLVVPATGQPMPGDIVCFPTIRLDGHPLPFIGHGAIVVDTSRAATWDPTTPQYHLLDVVQVCGPTGRKPAAIRTDGSVFDKHARDWPKPEHTTRLLRVVP